MLFEDSERKVVRQNITIGNRMAKKHNIEVSIFGRHVLMPRMIDMHVIMVTVRCSEGLLFRGVIVLKGHYIPIF